MAYVAPNSAVQFFKNTGLSPSHENTLYFSSSSARNSYFDDLVAASVSSVSYQRENRGWMRVQLPMSTLYNCDYLRFINTSFENKYFYCFITEVDYVNNNTTEVHYEVDYLMTWMGTFNLKQCFIERQHVTNDGIGVNLKDEGLSTGKYVEEAVVNGDNYGSGASTIRLQVANQAEAQATYYGGIFNPTTFTDSDSAGTIAEAIQDLTDSTLSDNIVNIYMVPSAFKTYTVVSDPLSVSKPYSDIDGYVPRNKKLYTYPYKYLEVDNSEGSTKEFYYEFFGVTPPSVSSGTCSFTVVGASVNNVELALCPINYNGHRDINFSNRLTMTHFPQCAWSIDNYRAYLAQKNAVLDQDIEKARSIGTINTVAGTVQGAANSAINVGGKALMGAALGTAVAPGVGTLAGAAIGAATGAATNAISGAVNKEKNVQSIIKENEIDNTVIPEMGSRVKGSAGNDLAFSYGRKRFTFHMMCITRNYAQMLDDYFDMYGYKVCEIGTPNMNARNYWTYVKTVGCDVGGSVPAYDASVIESIFDNGVRFWHNLSEMGNYELDNTV